MSPRSRSARCSRSLPPESSLLLSSGSRSTTIRSSSATVSFVSFGMSFAAGCSLEGTTRVSSSKSTGVTTVEARKRSSSAPPAKNSMEAARSVLSKLSSRDEVNVGRRASMPAGLPRGGLSAPKKVGVPRPSVPGGGDVFPANTGNGPGGIRSVVDDPNDDVAGD